VSSTAPAHTKQASLGSEMSSSIHSLEAAAKVQHELPPKPVSVNEENRKKGYFPISWRVIGGGVTLGGKRMRICRFHQSFSDIDLGPTCPSYIDGHCKEGDDCKLSHDDPEVHDDGSNSLAVTLDASGEVSTPSASTADESQNGKGDMGLTILLTSPAESDLTSESDFIADDEAALGAASLMPKATPRQRPISMSIPASPRTDISSVRRYASALTITDSVYSFFPAPSLLEVYNRRCFHLPKDHVELFFFGPIHLRCLLLLVYSFLLVILYPASRSNSFHRCITFALAAMKSDVYRHVLLLEITLEDEQVEIIAADYLIRWWIVRLLHNRTA
jgi:hypothetical protein